MRSIAHHEPILLGYYPAFSTNPFQALLYGRLREAGIAPVAIRRIDAIDELTELQRSGIETVLHIHWLHLILRDEDAASSAASAAVARFLARLDTHAAAGGRIAWTVHNILPHEARSEAHEAALAAEVARRADVIHVLAAGTADYVAPYFEIPRDRVFHVPHPSYAGVYPDYISPDEARFQLGLMPADKVYVVLGGIRPYKGIEELLDAWEALPPDASRRLVVAGKPSDEPGIAELLQRAAVTPGVVLDARKLPMEEIQVFLRAADVAVLPYRRALNSGALLLALTFGVPVLVPGASGLAELVGRTFAVTYDLAAEGALASALLEAERLRTPEARAAAAATAARFEPAEISRTFARGLRERLAGEGK